MKPWERYAQEGPKTGSGGEGPWTRYMGSSQASEDFQKAVQRLLGHEGGYSNDPEDRGGETNFGISSKAHPGIDVKNLKEDEAKQIYLRDYWEPLGADKLPEPVRELAFDSAVQHGVEWTKNALAETGNTFEGLFQKRKKFYQTIVRNDNSQAKFLDGWMNRLDSFSPKLPWLKYGGKE